LLDIWTTTSLALVQAVVEPSLILSRTKITLIKIKSTSLDLHCSTRDDATIKIVEQANRSQTKYGAMRCEPFSNAGKIEAAA